MNRRALLKFTGLALAAPKAALAAPARMGLQTPTPHAIALVCAASPRHMANLQMAAGLLAPGTWHILTNNLADPPRIELWIELQNEEMRLLARRCEASRREARDRDKAAAARATRGRSFTMATPPGADDAVLGRGLPEDARTAAQSDITLTERSANGLIQADLKDRG